LIIIVIKRRWCRPKGADGSSSNEDKSRRMDNNEERKQRVPEKYNSPAEVQEQRVLLEHRTYHWQY
jgi:hypothetical protein